MKTGMEKKPQFEKIEDYGPYDGTAKFTLAEVAFLWCGLHPPAHVQNDDRIDYSLAPYYQDDDGYPPAIIKMNSEIKNTLSEYWRSISFCVHQKKDRVAAEERLNHQYRQWGELYREFLIEFQRELSLPPTITFHPIEKVGSTSRQKFEIRYGGQWAKPVYDVCGQKGIVGLFSPNRIAGLFRWRKFSREALLDYAKKRRGSVVPRFLSRPDERPEKKNPAIEPYANSWQGGSRSGRKEIAVGGQFVFPRVKDFSIYRTRKKFQLHEAAFLWVGFAPLKYLGRHNEWWLPHQPIHGQNMKFYGGGYQIGINELPAEIIEVARLFNEHLNKTLSAWGWSYEITTEELRKIAVENGLRPPFLFPENVLTVSQTIKPQKKRGRKHGWSEDKLGKKRLAYIKDRILKNRKVRPSDVIEGMVKMGIYNGKPSKKRMNNIIAEQKMLLSGPTKSRKKN